MTTLLRQSVVGLNPVMLKDFSKFSVYIQHFPQLKKLTDSGYFSGINIYLAEFSHNKLRHFVVWQLLAAGSMCFGSR